MRPSPLGILLMSSLVRKQSVMAFLCGPRRLLFLQRNQGIRRFLPSVHSATEDPSSSFSTSAIFSTETKVSEKVWVLQFDGGSRGNFISLNFAVGLPFLFTSPLQA